MKLNRKWLLVVALVLSMTMAISGTLAYLQDSTATANVMTLGSVHIEQHEYERADEDEDGEYDTKEIDGMNSYVLTEYTQGKPILPIVGDPTKSSDDPMYAGYDSTSIRMTQVDSYGTAAVFAGKNAQDKFVTVENTGKSDAYVRTLIAFEIGNATLVNADYPYSPLISAEVRAEVPEKNQNGDKPWTYGYKGYVTIDGNNYVVYEYIYTGAKLTDGSWRHEGGVLPAGDTTYPSLCQVYMASWAGNDEVEAIDGNGNGYLDILVLSQAIQADGFADAKTALDAGFGEANAETVAEWFGGVAYEEDDSVPFAEVHTFDASETLEHPTKAGVTILAENRTIDTTSSSMGVDVGEISLNAAYQFEPTISYKECQESEYRNWVADFVVVANKPVPKYSIGLAGYYDFWCSYNNNKWVMLTSSEEIPAGREVRLVSPILEGSNISVTYELVCLLGNDDIGFLCGVGSLEGETFTDGGKEVTGQAPTPGTTITVELRLFEVDENGKETGKSVTIGTYEYTFN